MDATDTAKSSHTHAWENPRNRQCIFSEKAAYADTALINDYHPEWEEPGHLDVEWKI